MDAHLAGGIDGTVEGVVAKLMGVVAQEIVRLQGEVVAQSGEVLVMDTAAYECHVVVAVEDGIIVQQDVIRNGVGMQVLETVLGAQLLHVHLAGGVEVAYQVDVAQVAHQIHLSFRPCLDVVHETAAEALHEFHIRALRLDAQVYVVSLRRYISVYQRLVLLALVSHGVDVYLAQFLVEVYVGMKYSHRTVFELEVLDVELGVGVRIIEDALHYRLA